MARRRGLRGQRGACVWAAAARRWRLGQRSACWAAFVFASVLHAASLEAIVVKKKRSASLTRERTNHKQKTSSATLRVRRTVTTIAKTSKLRLLAMALASITMRGASRSSERRATRPPGPLQSRKARGGHARHYHQGAFGQPHVNLVFRTGASQLVGAPLSPSLSHARSSRSRCKRLVVIFSPSNNKHNIQQNN